MERNEVEESGWGDVLLNEAPLAKRRLGAAELSYTEEEKKEQVDIAREIREKLLEQGT